MERGGRGCAHGPRSAGSILIVWVGNVLQDSAMIWD